MNKPLIVSDRIEADTTIEHDPAMSYAAWRTCKLLREVIEGCEAPMTAEGILVIVSSLEENFKEAYDATR